MTCQELKSGTGIKPLKTPLRDVPHLVLEPTLECNLRCRICYNYERGHRKTLEQIKAEIGLGMAKRRLETISILGGEPTLHPDLPEIVRHIKSLHLTCEILTNGLRLLAPGGGELLDRLKAAGLDRVVFHVDAGQPRAEGVEETRRRLAGMAEERNLFFALSVTVYPETQGTIPALMRRYARFRFFDGVLATLTRDTDSLVGGADRAAPRTDLAAEYGAIARQMDIEPANYVPTSLSDEDISWLQYFYFINAETGRTFDLAPRTNRILRSWLRRLSGREVFGATTNPAWFPLTFLGTALLDVLVRGRLGRLRGLLRKGGLGAVRFHFVIIQQGPEFNRERESFQLCYHCPDATIRGGRLTPVCLADRISPIGRDRERNVDALFEAVYRHLEEF
jgi:hypothetical protein